MELISVCAEPVTGSSFMPILGAKKCNTKSPEIHFSRGTTAAGFLLNILLLKAST